MSVVVDGASEEGDDIVEVGERARDLVSALGEDDGFVQAVEGGDAELQLTDLNLRTPEPWPCSSDLEGSGSYRIHSFDWGFYIRTEDVRELCAIRC